MNAFSPWHLDEVQPNEFVSLPFGGPRPSTRNSAMGRIYERVVASWRREPELAEMGPSQVHELLVMRGRD
jgi:hypothetical protein